MDQKEKHIAENRGVNEGRPEPQEAKELMADGKNRKRNSTFKINKLWLWLGVIILIFILFWWLFSIGTFEDIIGTANG